MLHFGGFTFDTTEPKRYIKIPNVIAARRIAQTVLRKYKLHGSLNSALKSLGTSANIRAVLACYRELMVQRDVYGDDFNKSEENHRDCFYFAFLKNHFVRPHPEFKVIKVIHYFIHGVSQYLTLISRAVNLVALILSFHSTDI